MPSLSIDPVFLPPTTDTSVLLRRIRRSRSAADTLAALTESDFNTAYDALRTWAAEMIERGELQQGIRTLEETASYISALAPQAEGHTLDLHAAIMQILTALSIRQDDTDRAAVTAAEALSLLAQEPRRKDLPFMQLLGCLLHDIACLHSQRHEYRQAEREIEKSIKIFERLARLDAARYAPAHVMALNGATAIYRNRVRQAELLAHYQAATTAYLQMVNAGVEDAATRLVDSLRDEGDTLIRMGRHREAIQYYSRALKYLTKLESEFTLRQLELSISLGEAMLSVSAMRDKGVHLLNTMLHKATKINALEQHRRIVDALYHAKSRSLDILSLWHKIFPR